MKKLVLIAFSLLILCAIAIYIIEYKKSNFSNKETREENYKNFNLSTDDNVTASSVSNDNKKVAELEEKETWQKVAEHLYFDKKSVDIQYDNYIVGVFKEYLYGEDRKNNEDAAYQIIETAAPCNIKSQGSIKKLEYPIYKFYDENNNFISEDNIHKAWREEFPDGHLGITHPESERNGDIYFNTLCSYAK